MSRIQRSLLIYAVSAGFVIFISILRETLHVKVEGASAFLIFLVAVMASAWLGGIGPGLFATALAAIVGNYFFMEPRWGFGLGNLSERVEFVLFLAEGIVITILADRLHRARDQAIRGQAGARELERRILEISDAEQRRIGYDLHDGLGQHLTGIALMARRLHQRLVSEDSRQSEDAAKICDLARTSVEWTHDLCRSLSPPVLEREGLAAGLSELAANAENLFSIHCRCHVDGQSGFRDVTVAAHLFRVAQEAISNAAKHGKAANIDVYLSSQSDELCLRITDDGGGFNPAAQDADGMGLRIMRYRANMIGAHIEVERGSQGGTVVTCRYPIPKNGGVQPNSLA